jgi:hypothetical protein
MLVYLCLTVSVLMLKYHNVPEDEGDWLALAIISAALCFPAFSETFGSLIMDLVFGYLEDDF